MSRAERLLALMQCLRRQRGPVRGAALADELGISLRTLYRDIASLQAQGARIDGEAGLGYVLKPGFVLPPLMFTDEEIEALVLGSRWVAQRGDRSLAAAARDAVAKIAAVLPPALRHELEATALLVGPNPAEAATPTDGPAPDDAVLAELRRAIRAEFKVQMRYTDAQGRVSERIVWPFALGYFDRVRVVVGWSEAQDGFRHFRADRIAGLQVLESHYPRRRQALLKAWRQVEGVELPW